MSTTPATKPAADRERPGTASTAKLRLDVLLVERGLFETRAKAQALVRAGEVYVDGQRHDKPGMAVAVGADIVVRQPHAFVGRGGQKLAAALDRFGLDPAGLVCLDVGASTGGFTDCLLQRGAAAVYAVDVGRGQLAWSLRQDPRVVSLERTDVRSLRGLPGRSLAAESGGEATADAAPPSPPWVRADLAVVDVSFISLTQVLPALPSLVKPSAPVILLVKPQFEVGKGMVGKGGVVRDPELHRRVLQLLGSWLLAGGWTLHDAMRSVITGGDGNAEFLVFVRPPAARDSAEVAGDDSAGESKPPESRPDANGFVDAKGPGLAELVRRAMIQKDPT